MTMRIFPASLVNQGSDLWWELRRGIPTSSSFDRILTPKTEKPSASQEKYIAELAGDVANLNPNWFTERMNRPPNPAVEEGIRREAESRRWLEFDRDCTVQQVGFCLHDNGLWGCSPDGLLITDTGALDATLELKNPQLETQAQYILDGNGQVPSEYRCQCHGHLIVTGLSTCVFLSFCPGLDPVMQEVHADKFTDKLREALDGFTKKYLDALTRLKLLARWEQQRKSILDHLPEESPA
jgi:hypothetical protein